MGTLRAAQFEYDNRMSPAVADDGANQVAWMEKHTAATFELGESLLSGLATKHSPAGGPGNRPNLATRTDQAIDYLLT